MTTPRINGYIIKHTRLFSHGAHQEIQYGAVTDHHNRAIVYPTRDAAEAALRAPCEYDGIAWYNVYAPGQVSADVRIIRVSGELPLYARCEYSRVIRPRH